MAASMKLTLCLSILFLVGILMDFGSLFNVLCDSVMFLTLIMQMSKTESSSEMRMYISLGMESHTSSINKDICFRVLKDLNSSTFVDLIV